MRMRVWGGRGGQGWRAALAVAEAAAVPTWSVCLVAAAACSRRHMVLSEQRCPGNLRLPPERTIGFVASGTIVAVYGGAVLKMFGRHRRTSAAS